MLPKKQRLSRKEFDPILRGKSIPSASFTLRISSPISSKNGSMEPKLSVVVSKKAAKKAVDRNAITRRAYEAIRAAHTAVPLPPLSAAAFMKGAAKKVSLKDLKEEFVGVFRKIG